MSRLPSMPDRSIKEGSVTVQYIGQAEATRAADGQRWRDVSASTDVKDPGLLPDLRF